MNPLTARMCGTAPFGHDKTAACVVVPGFGLRLPGPVAGLQTTPVVLAFDDDTGTHVTQPGDVSSILRPRLGASIDAIVVE